ncbi:hypothetical protein [Streptomyces sp. SP18CS02]|uniref:hypothetical protein n=1 Tax=Streptomyces sp. SP18CS02 TaxID=3002531 RepID=UPI002E796339|nr:hypothetical protein [Streptomyces sp. SP18CS02]MEE1754044.1 hypothetical protein [Streptomyces sp. SP18CS02]
MAETPYPHLGWNPAPGSPPEIARLRTKLSSSATALGTAHRLVDQLLGESSHWHGEAADAFREALDGDLPRYLKNAHRSLTKAANRLGGWHDDLVGYQATAKRYETQAGLHASKLQAAESAHATTSARADAPASDLRSAADAVTRAREALSHVRRLARELEETHHTEAARVAKTLNEATDRLAPKEPGAWDKALKWIEEDLGDVLSDISAVAGFLGLVLGAFFPPVGLALLIVATGASMGALALHLADPKVTASLKDGFTEGKFDADFWDSAVTITGDALGSVPGIASLAQGAKVGAGALRTASAASEPGAFGIGAREFASASKNTISELSSVENPLHQWALRETSPATKKVITYGFPATGAVTAGSHYTSYDDDSAVANSATGVDGARAVLEDGPTSAAKVAHAWALLRP